jgi:phthalate 3,4-cis-dihydrodiol dehydrogenase
MSSAQYVATEGGADTFQALAGIALTLSTSAYDPGRGGALHVASTVALRGLAIRLGHDRAPQVRVNGVPPSGTLNADMRGLRSLDLHERRLGATPSRQAELSARTPLKVALSPGDHAGPYVFLASDRARRITLEVLSSDGGIGVAG